VFNYVGHPYYDVGIATLAAFAEKTDPQQLTSHDLEKAVDYMTREYVQQPLRSYLTVVFPNSGFTNPAFFKKPDRQQEYARRVLRSYAEDMPVLNEQCVFTGKPAVAIAFGDKEDLPLGRAFRQHIPLLTAENAINFYPYGDNGLPVSGPAILAMQALPLGCAKSSGRMLMVHSDNPDITYHFASEFLKQNRQTVQVAQQASSNKMPESHHKHHTLLIETLLEAESMRGDALQEDRPFTITAYHLSNSGQGADLDIYFLPMQVVGFLRVMETAKFRDAWHNIVRKAWEMEPPRKRKKQNKEEPFQPARNWLYEDLFDLPDKAKHFIRTYFLRIALRYARGKTDPRPNDSLENEADLVSWAITAQFLRRILNMDQHRIEQIREMADRLAKYIRKTDDKYVLTNFRTQRYHVFRTTLLRANSKQLDKGGEPLIKFDSYIDVFELAAGDSHIGWRLARDLVFIRIMEQLYYSGWLSQNQGIVEEATEYQPEESQEAFS